MKPTDPRPLIAHVMHRFDTGGLENGVVNLINRLPAERFRHAVIALTEITEFGKRIQHPDVQLIAMKKPPGQGFLLFPRMHALLRRLRPAIVHTRNLGALEMVAPAAMAGVPLRIHGEHGWEMSDSEGQSRRFRLIRRLYRPFVHRYVALSRHLERYLVDHVGVRPRDISQLYNGVDTQQFRPCVGDRVAIAGSPFTLPELWIIGTVGRLSPIKDQVMLAHAFVRALELAPEARSRLRLVIGGDGPLRSEIQRVLEAGGARELAWLAGNRDDVPEFMRGLDAFALPSLAEGVSNTILEAMATGLPVVATDVGGNAELLVESVTGRLVPARDPDTMAQALLADMRAPELAQARGRRARLDVERRFTLDGMVAAYGGLYDQMLARAAARGARKRATT